jgi:hypothetical protein
LLSPSLRGWLAADLLAWFVLDAVEQFDLRAIEGAYPAMVGVGCARSGDDGGAAALRLRDRRAVTLRTRIRCARIST